MREHDSHAFLVNTGWSGGAYGKGSRMSLKITRRIIDSILDGTLAKANWTKFPIFGFEIPEALEGIQSDILNPRNTWEDGQAYDETLKKLAGMFVENFRKYSDNDAGKELAKFGPAI